MARTLLILGSVVGHVGLIFALERIDVKESHAVTAIEVVESQKAPPPPVETKVEPPKPERAPRPMDNPKPVLPAPEAPTPTATPSLDALPDFGLELSGAGSPGGFGVAQGRAAPTAKPPVAKSLTPTLAKDALADPCAEGPAKPKLKHLPQPTYTDSARAAGVEGKVRIQITVDESGNVVEAKVLAPLGHGLDEAALTAARAASFEAAVRCGKPSRSTFTIAIRFSAS